MKNWKKRWFVLGDGKLYYYKTEVKIDVHVLNNFAMLLTFLHISVNTQEKIELTH